MSTKTEDRLDPSLPGYLVRLHVLQCPTHLADYWVGVLKLKSPVLLIARWQKAGVHQLRKPVEESRLLDEAATRVDGDR